MNLLKHLPAALRRASPDRLSGLALVASIAGLVMVMARLPIGLPLLLAGWLILAIRDQRLFVFTALAAIPLTTFGWNVELLIISGRVFDVRLAITFATAGLGCMALVIARPERPSLAEGMILLFVGWMIVSGLLAADSYLTWMPPVTRFVAYGSLFGLARRTLTAERDLGLATGILAVAFAVPTLAGLLQYFVGDAAFINEAARATTPGGRGPIALAFAGQLALGLGFALFSLTSSPKSRWWLAVAVIGAAGVLASATRLVTVTSWLVVALFSALRTRWRTAAIITLIFAAAFIIRPDLLGRFAGTVSEPEPSASQPADADDSGTEPAVEVDASVRFRFFVWSAILDEWTEHPITGIGPGMTAHVVSERSPAQRTAPHNDYIGVFAELSLPGLLLFLGTQVAVVIALYRRHVRTAGYPRGIIQLAGLIFVSVNVLGTLNNPMYFFDVQVGVWSLVGAALAVRPDPAGSVSPSSRHRA